MHSINRMAKWSNVMDHKERIFHHERLGKNRKEYSAGCFKLKRFLKRSKPQRLHISSRFAASYKTLTMIVYIFN